MFKCELSDTNIITSAFESIHLIVDEVQIQVDSDGLRLKALSRAKITFVNLELQSSVFDTYECDTPQSINIDTNEFMKVLKRCKTNDLMVISLTNDYNLKIEFKSNYSDRVFKIRLIDLEYDTPPSPNIPYNNQGVVLPVKVLKDVISDINIFSDRVKFEIKDDKLHIFEKGSFGECDTEYLIDEDINDTGVSGFSIEKVNELLKAEKFSNLCTLCLGEDVPLTLTYELVTGEGLLSFLLAPRLNEE